ncbi:MAG: CAAX prenyl protease-related protein [Bryobacterales bacterium]|nr:CAAX prenyl protease-related protein [Bryobacterales bacterium]
MPQPIMGPTQSEARDRSSARWPHPAAPYVAPFAAFLLILSVQDYLRFLGLWEAPLRFLVIGLVTLLFARRVLDLGVAGPVGALLLGVAVFGLWIAPDLLWPGFREHWLFHNRLLGSGGATLDDRLRLSPLFLVFRFLRAVVIVPIVEELFWRGWLMRWLIRSDFESVPLGSYTPLAFWASAILFATEHGSYWDVGLLAGIAYNLWIVKTKRLGDCILAHAVTNASLSAYVIRTGQWQYWP